MSGSLRDYVLSGPGRADIALADYAGSPLTVILGNRLTQKAGHDLVDALRLTDVPVLQVAHLKGVPRSVHAVAERDIVKGRAIQVERAIALRAERGLPGDGEDAAIGLALDWSGRLGADFAFGSRDREALVLVTDADLTVLTEFRTARAGSADGVDADVRAIRRAIESVNVKGGV